jgi:hypothetical protein
MSAMRNEILLLRRIWLSSYITPSALADENAIHGTSSTSPAEHSAIFLGYFIPAGDNKLAQATLFSIKTGLFAR